MCLSFFTGKFFNGQLIDLHFFAPKPFRLLSATNKMGNLEASTGNGIVFNRMTCVQSDRVDHIRERADCITADQKKLIIMIVHLLAFLFIVIIIDYII